MHLLINNMMINNSQLNSSTLIYPNQNLEVIPIEVSNKQPTIIKISSLLLILNITLTPLILKNTITSTLIIPKNRISVRHNRVPFLHHKSLLLGKILYSLFSTGGKKSNFTVFVNIVE